MSHRMERINELIKKEMSLVIFKEIDDPRIKNNMITITRVDTAKDLSHAKVYFVCLNKEKQKEVIQALNACKGLFVSILKKRLTIRYIPAFAFLYDQMIEETNQVLDKIRNIEIEEKNNAKDKKEEYEERNDNK